MKKKITRYFLLALVCLGLQSCLFQEEDYFDDSSANRASADVEKCDELLKSAPNGWIMEYYLGDNYLLGGFTLYCLFDGEKVTMASQLYGKGQTAVSSLYQVLSEQSTMLTFDTYNPLLHVFGAPNGSMSTDPNGNLKGDYEFIIIEASADRIELKGKKYGNRIVMTPLAENTTWKKYMGVLSDMDKTLYQYTYDIYIDGLYTGTLQRSSYSFDVTYFDEVGTVKTMRMPFMISSDGIRFREPLTIDGVTMQHFAWNAKDGVLEGTDKGSTKVKLIGVNPDGYVNYENYIGKYTMNYYTYDTTGTQMIQKSRTVSLLQKEKDESYSLTGAVDGYQIPVYYDKTNGILLLNAGELISESTGQYLYLTACDITTGTLTKASGIGLFSYIYPDQPSLTFTFVDNGRWGQANGFFLGIFDSKKDNANFISYIGEVIAGVSFIKE